MSDNALKGILNERHNALKGIAPQGETDDLNLVYCPECNEEYQVPESMEICPICGVGILEFI